MASHLKVIQGEAFSGHRNADKVLHMSLYNNVDLRFRRIEDAPEMTNNSVFGDPTVV